MFFFYLDIYNEMSASFENYKEHMLNVSVDIFAPYVLRVIISHVPESSSLEERMVGVP